MIYIYTYIHIHTYTYIHIHTYTYIHIHTYTYIHIHTYIYVYVCEKKSRNENKQRLLKHGKAIQTDMGFTPRSIEKPEDSENDAQKAL